MKPLSSLLIIGLFYSACTVITPQWPNPDRLPSKIVGKHRIGKKTLVSRDQTTSELMCPVAPGLIYLKNKKVIRGTVWLQPYSFYSGNIKHNSKVEIISRPWNEIEPENINLYFIKQYSVNIDSIKMDIPLPDGMGDTTTFVNDNNIRFSKRNRDNIFYRRLLSKGKISIYDDSHYGKGYESTTVITVSLTSDSLFTIRYSQTEIQEFIKKRYKNTHIQFATLTDMLRFILNKETELQNSNG